jgi:DNA mismatch endonuclease, patch repair protein
MPSPSPASPSDSHPASWASTPGVRSRMQQQRGRDTAPELALRRALHGRGLRYRLHRQVVPGTRRSVDIVFGPTKVAVFVDGCFWHGCPQHGRREHAVNGWYWPNKIAGNLRRDLDSTGRLAAAGWFVIRVWEHENPALAADWIETTVRGVRRVAGGATQSGN